MAEKRKASGDAPGTSRPPARMRVTSTDDEDVSSIELLLDEGLGRGGERTNAEVVPSPPPSLQSVLMAGIGAKPAANSGQPAPRQIDYIDCQSLSAGEEAEVTSRWRPLSDLDAEASPSGNEEELVAAVTQTRPPPPADQPSPAEAQPLPHPDESVGSVATIPEMVAPAPAPAHRR
ncbi:uncharacterized protein LOC123409934 [Hordeum vulgare subsp. vulgare]|uniref:uncharacterized protein LOC123409934 n=1 Tax=Hordeum vulgare subsp. vulgare TaxID=112509 RepID=UPI00162BF3BD|nr:uncharacterized protein LOC123409934 [Hordeum vulgare subsp. vulgare]KAI5016676.1 hypothetical protein ZWY2020_006527 [Hordeum vulgare]